METNINTKENKLTTCSRMTPREMCKTCDNWLGEDEAEFCDIPHCMVGGMDLYDCDRYLDGMVDKCPHYLNM